MTKRKYYIDSDLYESLKSGNEHHIYNATEFRVMSKNLALKKYKLVDFPTIQVGEFDKHKGIIK